MQVIKFRAWNTELKQFETANDVYIEANNGDVVHTHHDIVAGIPSDTKVIGCDHLKISQYTGIVDKNWKEIWEGDVLLTPVGRGVVAMTNGSFCVNGNPIGMFGGLELVGNVYSKPELLLGSE